VAVEAVVEAIVAAAAVETVAAAEAVEGMLAAAEAVAAPSPPVCFRALGFRQTAAAHAAVSEAPLFTPEAPLFTPEAPLFTLAPEAPLFTPEAPLFTMAPEAPLFTRGSASVWGRAESVAEGAEGCP